MEPRTYLRAVDAAVREGVPDALGEIQHQGRGSLAKWWYGNQAIHYESTLRPRQQSIEIGLHFEADELTNARLLAAFRAHARPIARRLGDVRIEEWDRGWARVWEPIALTEPPGLRNGTAVGERIAAYVSVLEPILRDELPGDVVWSLGATPRLRTRTAPVKAPKSLVKARDAAGAPDRAAKPARESRSETEVTPAHAPRRRPRARSR